MRARPRARSLARSLARSGAGLLALGLVLAAAAQASIAQAACPAAAPGREEPPQAQAEFLDNPPWRARVAALDRELADREGSGSGGSGVGGAGLGRSSARLVFLGDSITEAWDRDIFAGRFGRYGALNLGVRGDTTQGLLWRLPRLGLGSRLTPRLIVLLIGTNNTWPDGDADAVAIGIGRVVATLRALSPASRILLVGILPRGMDPADPWRRMGARVNRLIAACADASTVFFAAPGGVLLGKAGELPAAIAADYLHPTPRGYALLSAAIAGEVERLLEP